MMNRFWSGKKVLVTGHTGFKGSWLCAWLQHLGAEVTGFSLPASEAPNLAACLSLELTSVEGDITNAAAVSKAITDQQPDIVFHLAAQALVRASYQDPLGTFLTNAYGTAALLDASRHSPATKVIVNITTDKVYENKETLSGYTEEDRLGGYDAYSASKACSELITSSYRDAFLAPLGKRVVTARAGNVIGGGDWAPDRIVPDLVRSITSGQSPVLRNPHAIRPWQHVLEPLHGYLLLAEKLWEDEKFGGAWNFGQTTGQGISVGELASRLIRQWGNLPLFTYDNSEQPHETNTLLLQSDKARNMLGWHSRLSFDETIAWTSDWYRAYYNGENMNAFTLGQITQYEQLEVNSVG
ncbi:CDP-glucose 4,6-dehydratase [Paenibacillus glycanilyticus]|uniref:CDP-glucose 4,6-dehydratase n=1 Tax=Paenibacillus glycanilyticus TaxID=126569 RepID=A0ABQ6GBI3_9BACL|nr:CDP-glucose 4,6-dehydratase [Paenibacillus glycanilyticus]GLX68311.1 CDP-glucose 4,6-dehydratase [Paenibacillus glycanilyticus]